MNRVVMVLFLTCFSKTSFGAYVNTDSVNFTDTTKYVVLVNTSGTSIVVDSIAVTFRTGHPFIGEQFFYDTGTYKNIHSKMYGDFWESMRLPIGDRAVVIPVGNTRLSIRSRDSVKIFHVRLGNCWGCLTSGFDSALRDTVRLTYYFSDRSRDSLIAIVELLYGSAIGKNTAAKRTFLKKNSAGRVYMLNGRLLQNSKVNNVRIIKN